jgi:protein involved in ribonucleotide reduction
VLVVYDSRTGNVERFVHKVGLESVKIEKGLIVDKPFVLVTYTDALGQPAHSTVEFLACNDRHLVGNILGIAVSGNRVWGSDYGRAGDTIASWYKIPLLLKFELAGLPSDVDKFKKRMSELAGY